MSLGGWVPTLLTCGSLIVFLLFDESSHELKVARYRFQNNRSSAPPIVMIDGEASVGYLLFWLKSILAILKRMTR
ncbi:MAG: hypothetical protein A3I26_02680 [Candidatus Yanofskybacteria bacterium RIFCSPLOWO2_02_FULL_43_10]|nr:MAG: hypothetical protein A3I26_02680 [Candidatus Yanofskybacteria bacterium RIFCSPLOWO2_02_FULL_43_10]